MPRTKLPKGSVPVTFRLPREIQKLLLEKAQREKTTVSELIRSALRQEITATQLARPAKRAQASNHSRQE
jgi:Ribbon-helix-helix protein, copG family